MPTPTPPSAQTSAHSGWQLGTLHFDSRAIQGPLAGYSNAAFRQLLWQFGGLAYACTEMLPASTVIREHHDASNRYTYRAPSETHLCYQLSGHCPHTLGQAAEVVTALGADLIDLNAGCPKTKIRKKAQGSALLDAPEQLCAILHHLKKTVAIPITVKIRVPNPSCLGTTKALIERLNDTGVDGLIIHGRHWCDDYLQPLYLDHMAAVVERANCPVIANGDVQDVASYQALLKHTSAAAVMIARAGFYQPWLFQHIERAMQHQSTTPPSLDEIGHIFLQHIGGLLPFMTERTACLQARTIGRYYSTHLPRGQRAHFIKQLNQLPPTREALSQHIQQTFHH